MGVIRALGKLVRYPGLIPILLAFLAAIARQDFARELEARRRLRAFAKKHGKSPMDSRKNRAREAYLLLRTGEFAEARKRLLALLKDTAKSVDSDGRHYALFARYWIATIDCKPEQSEYWARLAQQEGIGSSGLIEIPPPLGNLMAKEWDEEVAALMKQHGIDLPASD